MRLSAAVALVVAVLPALGRAEPPVTLKAILQDTDSRSVAPTFCDYNGNGVQDLLMRRAIDSWNNEVDLVDGLTGLTLRSYISEQTYEGQIGAVESLDDIDGDGYRDFLFGAGLAKVGQVNRQGKVYGVSSSSPSGRVNLLPPVYTLTEASSYHGFFGGYLGRTAELGLVSWSDNSRVLVIDPASGQSLARLQGGSGFGSSLGRLGDITGDGVEDFIVSSSDGAHVVDGTTRSSQWTNVSVIPGAVIATLTHGWVKPGIHGGSGDRELFANLGDPDPNDGRRQALIISGSPWCNYYAGGFIAHMLTQGDDGVFSPAVVAYYGHNLRNSHWGFDVISLGDVNNDGLADAAILQQGGENGGQGKIVVVSGRGLLDGYQASDIIQEIVTGDDSFFYGGMRGIGDYDGDGRMEFVAATLGNSYGHDARIYSVTPATLSVEIDIKPGSDNNPINLGSRGLIPVAILTTADFDATTVDPETVQLAEVFVATRGNGKELLVNEEDVDDDGNLDLLVHFETQELVLSSEATTSVLTGQTYDGTEIEGSDSIVIVPR